MKPESLPAVQRIRQFNRFYTTVLGLTNQHLLHSPFSLAEARVLYELGQTPGCTANLLMDRLQMDAGYLSRILKRFEKDGLARRVQWERDRRCYDLSLTDKGRETLTALDARSSEQIGAMVEALTEAEQHRLVGGMSEIETLLAPREEAAASPVNAPAAKPRATPGAEEPLAVRCDLRPGDVGEMIRLHGMLYSRECGYDTTFEGYVCRTFADFIARYDPTKDRIWLAQRGEQIVGSIAIVSHTPQKAQLRWFLLLPEMRGRGLGKTMLQNAMDFCRERHYRTVFLETTDDQQKAIRMYEQAGFRQTDAREASAWGVRHRELTFTAEL